MPSSSRPQNQSEPDGDLQWQIHMPDLTDLGRSGPGLLRSLADNWWLLLLQGMVAIAFGVLAFFWPGLTLVTLVLLWGELTP